MPRPARWALELAFGVVAGLLVYGVAAAALDAFDRETGEPLRLLGAELVADRPAPDFELPDRQGRQLRLSSLRGRPVVLNLWSVACPPCIEELPSLSRLDRVGRERGTFSVVTVCIDATDEQLVELLPRGSELTVLLDPERRVVEGLYDTRMFPETFLIDRRGRIRARFDGRREWASPVVLSLLEAL